MKNTKPIGGVVRTVQIDETVVSRAKYRWGRFIPARWVFGGYDITTKKSFLVVHIPDKKAETLLPLIQRHILPDAEIYSGMWGSYSRISSLPASPLYIHLTVNH